MLYSPLIKFYIQQGLIIDKIVQYLEYIPSRPFQWFCEEVSQARREADENPDKKQEGETCKLKGNSFYGKMTENLEKHFNISFTKNEKKLDILFRNPFFEYLDKIGDDAFEIKMRKKKIFISRSYQCGIAVYQLAKLRMLEFYYNFLDKYISRKDFQLLQMDTDSFYMQISGEKNEDIVKPKMREMYEKEKHKWIVTDKYSLRVPGLFKIEFEGTRMISLTSKCYFADNFELKLEKEIVSKISCKGINKSQNNMTWERYYNSLQGENDFVKNTGFRKENNKVKTYSQVKLGLSAYYDKRRILDDNINTEVLW